jgi:hypothetical protein
MTLHAYARTRSLGFAEQLAPERHMRKTECVAHPEANAAAAGGAGRGGSSSTGRRLRDALSIGFPATLGSASNRRLKHEPSVEGNPRNPQAAMIASRFALVNQPSPSRRQETETSSLRQTPDGRRSQYHQDPADLSATSLGASFDVVLPSGAAKSEGASNLRSIAHQRPELASVGISSPVQSLPIDVLTEHSRISAAIVRPKQVDRFQPTVQTVAKPHTGSDPTETLTAKAQVYSRSLQFQEHSVDDHLSRLRSRADQVLAEHKGLNVSGSAPAIAYRSYESKTDRNAPFGAVTGLQNPSALESVHLNSDGAFDTREHDGNHHIESILQKILTISGELMVGRNNHPLAVRAPDPRMRMNS